MTSSQYVFKMWFLCMHAHHSQSLSPLVDGRVNNVLLLLTFNESLLLLIDTVHKTFIQCHLLLHNTSDFIIYWIQVWVVW